jgi:hypothetical protein
MLFISGQWIQWKSELFVVIIKALKGSTEKVNKIKLEGEILNQTLMVTICYTYEISKEFNLVYLMFSNWWHFQNTSLSSLLTNGSNKLEYLSMARLSSIM